MTMEAEKSHDLPSAAGDPGNPVVQFPSEPQSLRTRGASGVNSSAVAGEDRYPGSVSEAGSKGGEFLLPLPFCSSHQTVSGLEDARPDWGRQTALLSPPIQMLMSCRRTLTGTPSNNS